MPGQAVAGDPRSYLPEDEPDDRGGQNRLTDVILRPLGLGGHWWQSGCSSPAAHMPLSKTSRGWSLVPRTWRIWPWRS